MFETRRTFGQDDKMNIVLSRWTTNCLMLSVTLPQICDSWNSSHASFRRVSGPLSAMKEIFFMQPIGLTAEKLIHRQEYTHHLRKKIVKNAISNKLSKLSLKDIWDYVSRINSVTVQNVQKWTMLPRLTGSSRVTCSRGSAVCVTCLPNVQLRESRIPSYWQDESRPICFQENKILDTDTTL